MRSESEMTREAKQATPREQLLKELMDSREPKTEREHAAAREIIKLRAAAAQALEALEVWRDSLTDPSAIPGWRFSVVGEKAVANLRAAIAEDAMQRLTDVQQEMEAPRVNQCAEVCERAKLCAICARGLEEMGQEPVAWKDRTYGNLHHQDFGNSIPLFTHPPRREWVGLTEIEICDIEADELTSASSETFSFARAIETKLKERNGG